MHTCVDPVMVSSIVWVPNPFLGSCKASSVGQRPRRRDLMRARMKRAECLLSVLTVFRTDYQPL